MLLTSFYADTHETAAEVNTRRERALEITRDEFLNDVDTSSLDLLERHLGRPCSAFYSFSGGFFTEAGGIDYVFTGGSDV